MVFAQGTKLTVTDCLLPPPVLTVYPPPAAELQSDRVTLLCVSHQALLFGHVTWLVAGSPVSSGVSTSSTVQAVGRTFVMSSALTIRTSDWNNNRVYTCQASLGSQSSKRHISKAVCGTH